MTQPQYGPPQGYGGPPPGWGPPAQGGWQQPPPQQPQQGGWGQQPQQPPGWGAPPQQPQGWGPPSPQDQQWNAQQQEAPPAEPTSLADFYSQPSTGGGAALKFQNVGDAHFGIVSRQLVDSDTQAQTGVGPKANEIQRFRDGRVKSVLKIPLNVTPSQDNQEGKAQWWAGPGARDQLTAAIAASGAPITTHPSGVQYYIPEPGSGLYIKLAGKRQSGAGMNPANVWEVQYFRPDRATQLAAQYRIEYPPLAELVAVPQNGNGGPGAPAAPTTPAAPGQAQSNGINFSQPPFQQPTPTQPQPSVADFAPPNPGQPGNTAQWGNDQNTDGNVFPTWQAVDGPPNPPQASQQPPAVPGPPPAVDWNQQAQNPTQQGYIPQATAPGGPQGMAAPGMTEQGQQLMASLTGQPGGPGGQQ